MFAVAFAVKGDDVACPLASVVSISVVVWFEKVPLAPELGAANVTGIPLIGLPRLSTTVATSGEPKALLTVARCGVPPVANTPAGARFIKVKASCVEFPDNVALTE